MDQIRVVHLFRTFWADRESFGFHERLFSGGSRIDTWQLISTADSFLVCMHEVLRSKFAERQSLMRGKIGHRGIYPSGIGSPQLGRGMI